MKTITNLYNKLKAHPDIKVMWFNFVIGLVYFIWQPLTQFTVSHPINDNTRGLVFLSAIILNFLTFHNKLNIRANGLLLQIILISNYGITMYLNSYHFSYMVGFNLILSLQGLTFKKHKELFIFSGYSLILCLILCYLSMTKIPPETSLLLFFCSLTVVGFGLMATYIRINTDLLVISQNNKIAELKIDQLNLKISESLTNLSSSLTHEINTPLTTILGYTEILDRQIEEKKVPDLKFVQKIENQVNKIKEITDMLGLLSLDPKRQDNTETINSKEIESHIFKYTVHKLFTSKISIKVKNEMEYIYKVNKGQMFYIINEMFTLFKQSKSKNIETEIFFETDSIKILSNKTDLLVNDLNTMSAQVIANKNNFKIVIHNEGDKYGIMLIKDQSPVALAS